MQAVDNNGKRARHCPCEHRRREKRYRVTMDWCYAIGVEEVGDLPCEYCADRKNKKGEKKCKYNHYQ